MCPSKAETLEEIFERQCTELGISPEAKQYRAVPRRRFQWDFAWPSHKLVVEIQGGVFLRGKSGHTSGVGVRRDAIKNNLAVLHGFTPYQFTTDLVRRGVAARFIRAVIDGETDTAHNLMRVPRRQTNGNSKTDKKRG